MDPFLSFVWFVAFPATVPARPTAATDQVRTTLPAVPDDLGGLLRIWAQPSP
jgi:hypothetical protein